MAKINKAKAFEPFYNAVLKLIDDLFESESLRYKNTQFDHYSEKSKKKKLMNKRFRAVFGVGGDIVGTYQEDIDRIATLYYQALAQIDKDYDPNKKPPLPIYVPRIHDDPTLVKLQLHINRAHSSVNYLKDEPIPLCSIRSDDGQPNQEMQNAHDELEQLGYAPTFVHDGSKLSLNADTATICDDYQCDSLQLRSATGSQIRASFFTRDQDGFLNKSKLQSIGVLLVPMGVDVVKSHARSRRTDAIYIADHPREIEFDFIDKRIKTGRVYKVSK